MARPVVGIIGNYFLINDTFAVQGAGESNITAIATVSDALPLMIPSLPDAAEARDVLDVVDGILLTGGRPNVHPEFYGHAVTEAHGTFDRNRDLLAFDLIRGCVERGIPLLGVCRGFQEINVAYGGTLHPEIRDLPGRMNHRMPPNGTLEQKLALRHVVSLTPGGVFARIFGAEEVLVNSLHGQGIQTPGERIVIEGYAPDGTPEALHVAGARGFAAAVQWHPEWRAAQDPVSNRLFSAFGEALRAGRMRAAG